MVKKADSSWRLCGDFRLLNGVTIPDAYPLPNMMDFAVKAAGCKIFSKIDLRKGYHQIPLHPADIQKTAITTPFGSFEFLRMPFGLEAVFGYLDDLEVASKNKQEHARHLRELFLRL